MGRKQALEIHGSERPIVDSLPASIALCGARTWCTHVSERDACVRETRACVCVPVRVCMCVCVHVFMCACCACGALSLSRCLDPLLLRPCMSAPVRVPVAVLVFFASAFMCLKRELPHILSLPGPFPLVRNKTLMLKTHTHACTRMHVQTEPARARTRTHTHKTDAQIASRPKQGHHRL
jgi:hypothetical protein